MPDSHYSRGAAWWQGGRPSVLLVSSCAAGGHDADNVHAGNAEITVDARFPVKQLQKIPRHE